MGIALHLNWPSFDAEMLRTGGRRALGLTLAPSANVFKLPDMTAWAVFVKVRSREKNYPFTYHLFGSVFSPHFHSSRKIFFNFFSASVIEVEILLCPTPSF